MRIAFILSFTALSASGCVTHAALEAADRRRPSSLDDARLLRCKIAHDAEGKPRLALVLRTRRGRILRAGDGRWFAAHPKAELYPVSVARGFGRRIRPERVQLSGPGGKLSAPAKRAAVEAELRERVLVAIDPRPESTLIVKVYWPPGQQLDHRLGMPAARLREELPFESPTREGLKRYGIRALLPLTVAADIALTPALITYLFLNPHC